MSENTALSSHKIEPDAQQTKRNDVDNDLRPWLYDFVLWILSIIVDLFFREVHPRSSWKVPKSGPVIFVAAPHANQFVDPLILFRVIRMEAHRRVTFLIAEKSLHRKAVGAFARAMGSVGVGRALDSTKPAKGKIYLPDPEGDPTLLKGIGTDFDGGQFQIGGLVVLPSVDNTAASTEIAEILGPEELRLKRAFKGSVALQQLTGRSNSTGKDFPMTDDQKGNGHISGAEVNTMTESNGIYGGTSFKVAPKVDQSKVYDQVFKKLSKGGCVGIFPEGGSHDRTELLPLKPGVAIMALGAMAADPTCNLKIVPCGMNYFHAHKFRSRAVVEFGTPLEVPPELVEEYKNGSRREAVSQMLELVYNALVAVTVTSPDYDTLMLIQAVRRLYNPKGKPLPLPMVVELNRRLVKGYTRYKDDPRIVNLKKNVMDYHKELTALNVRDHQLQYAKLSIFQVVGTLIYRVGKLAVLSAGVLPGLILFAPIFIAGKVISIRKAKEALAASTVKIQARDVVATWKLLVAMGLAPTLYTFYTVFFTWWTARDRVAGYMPEWVPLWGLVIFGYIFFPTITYAALRFGEVGMDILKSLRPLVLALNPSSSNTLVRLRVKRAELATEVTNLINELGPELFPDFDKMRIIHTGPGDGKTPRSPTAQSSDYAKDRPKGWADMFYTLRSGDATPDHSHTPSAGIGGGSAYPGHIPRNESFQNLGSIGMFSSHPQTPTDRSRPSSRSHSRPRQGGGLFGGLGMGFSSLNDKGALDDVSQKIRGAMKERGLMRRRGERQGDGLESMTVDAGDEDTSDLDSAAGSGTTTPGSEAMEFKKHV